MSSMIKLDHAWHLGYILGFGSRLIGVVNRKFQPNRNLAIKSDPLGFS